MKKILASLLALCLSLGILAGCGGPNTPAQSGREKTFVFGDTTFNAENEEPTINPTRPIPAGLASLRRRRDADEDRGRRHARAWLAESAVNVNATTWEIVIKDAVCFSNGKKCDAAAVKACLEHLIEVHERAAGNLKIASMEADGQKLTIVTSEPQPHPDELSLRGLRLHHRHGRSASPTTAASSAPVPMWRPRSSRTTM